MGLISSSLDVSFKHCPRLTKEPQMHAYEHSTPASSSDRQKTKNIRKYQKPNRKDSPTVKTTTQPQATLYALLALATALPVVSAAT